MWHKYNLDTLYNAFKERAGESDGARLKLDTVLLLYMLYSGFTLVFGTLYEILMELKRINR